MNNFIMFLFATISFSHFAYGESLDQLLSTDQQDTPTSQRVLEPKAMEYIREEVDGRDHTLAIGGTIEIPQGITLRSVMDLYNSRDVNVGNLQLKTKAFDWENQKYSLPLTFDNGATMTLQGWTSLSTDLARQYLMPLFRKFMRSDEWQIDAEDKAEDAWNVTRSNQLPYGFDWRVVDRQLSGKPGGLSPADQRNWTVRRFLQGFDIEAFSFQPGVPNGFNWRDFLEKNPALNARYLREQGISQTDLNQPEWQKKFSSWLHAIVRISASGGEAGYSWIAGLPRNFNWKTFAAQNPSVDARFRRENKLSPTGPITDPGMLAQRAHWLQVIAKLNMEGKDAGYSWLPGVEKGFNWKQALTSSVKSRYKREQLARTQKARVSGEYSANPKAYLTEGDFNADNSLRPESGWLGKQAVWVQTIKKLGQI